MMNKEQKKIYISEIQNFINTNDSVLVTHYQGLTVKQLDELRAEMRKNGIIFKITNNRITKLALKNTKYKDITDLFSGPTAVALSKDAITSSKILSKFSKNNQNLKILGGFMGKEVLKLEDVLKIATLPTLNEARIKIINILQSPARKLASILLAPGLKIAILAFKKSKQST
jgi:large subunit ribosomal protein L10